MSRAFPDFFLKNDVDLFKLTVLDFEYRKQLFFGFAEFEYFKRVIHCQAQFLLLPRFCDISPDMAFVDRLHDFFYIGVGRKHQIDGIRKDFPGFGEKTDPINARHAHIGDDDAGSETAQLPERICGACRCDHSVKLPMEGAANRIQHHRFIIDKENGMFHD